jgi:cytochrome c-type biogenesis protein CcmH/NrfG
MNREREQLESEISLREASLLDARREFEGGELTKDDLEVIERRENAGIARARDQLAALSDTERHVVARRLRKRRFLVVGVACLVVALGVLLYSTISPRQAGTSITGDLSLSKQQRVQQYLSEAETDIANGNATSALSAYQDVLSISPKNVAALTQVGWLEFSAGSSDQDLKVMRVGVDDLRQAISLAPKQAAPRLYYAIVADATPGNQALAKSEFKVFLALHPSKGQLAIAEPFLKRLHLSSLVK